jgi:pyridoxine 5-phosphate synthase
MSSPAIALSVNLNKVALVRNSRAIGVPSVERAARLALAAGAAGITVHPRPDGRHIRAGDVAPLARLVADHPGAEYNIEGNPFSGAATPGARPDYPGFLELVAAAARAGGVHQVTFVPDSPDQATSDHGWDLSGSLDALRKQVAAAGALGARVALFVDPDPAAMERAAATGASRVELYTEPYARAAASGDLALLELYAETARAAHAAGLGVNAGHDLNLENLPPFARRVPHLAEVSIGHALTADALWMGWQPAVAAYVNALRVSEG